MQKNNKQWMCTFLSIILCLSFLLPCVAESDAEQWDNSGAREYYLGILEDLEVFQSDEYLYYWRTVNSIEKDEFLAFAIDLGAKVIEKYPTKEDYGRVLSYVLTMQQINIAANISEQSAFDDFRNTGDYVLDVTDIVLSLLGIPETTSAISPVVGAFSFGKDTFSATSDSLTYYEMAITDYVCSDLFLKALIDNTDDEMLKAVAHTFLNENVSLLNKKLEIIGDCGESAAGNLGNYYIENIFFKTLQALDGTDMESVRWLGKAGEGFYNAVISTPKLAFDITMLAGNSLFGTSDQYKTYQEMTILAEVARSLSCEIQKTDVKNAKGQELEYALNKNYYLYKALITTGCRGEYLFFHLLDDHSGTNRGIVEFFTGKKFLSTDKIDELQEKQFSSIAYYYNVLVKSYQNQRRSICTSHCWENDRCTICGREKLHSEDTLSEYRESDSQLELYRYGDLNKRLTQINITYSDGSTGKTEFYYDEFGLLVSTVMVMPYYCQENIYSYDSERRLIAVQTDSNGDCWFSGLKAEYIYDSNGYLIQSTEVEGSRVTTYYENDSAGRCIRSTFEGEGVSCSSEYTYNNNSTEIEEILTRTDYDGNTTTDHIIYNFNDAGFITGEVCSGAFYSYNRHYTYDNKPFVTVAEDNDTPYRFYLADAIGHPIWQIEYIAVATMKNDTNGYLNRIITDYGDIYNFEYEKISAQADSTETDGISVDELVSTMQENTVQSDTVENIPAKQPTQIRRIE